MKRGAFILLLLLLACFPQNTTGPEVPELYVWCVLVEGHRVQFALVDRVYRPDEPAGKGVRGAEVRVAWEGGEVPFFETLLIDTLWEGDSLQLDTLMWGYMDTTADQWLRPDRSYHLTVRLPDGRQVEGHTTLPGDFRILSPAPYDTLRVPSSTLILWTRSEGSVFSALYVQGPFPDTLLSFSEPLPESYREALSFAPDTTSAVLSQPFYFPEEGWYRIEIRPENRDLYRWNAFAEGNLSGEAAVTGVFGGMVARHLWLYITR